MCSSGISLEKLNLCGRNYLIEYCYIKEKEKQKNSAFNVYVTDTLKFINESIVNQLGGNSIKHHYYELISNNMTDNKEIDSDKVINKIKDKLNKLGEN